MSAVEHHLAGGGRRRNVRLTVIVLLVLAVTLVHFLTEWQAHHYRVIYGSLYLAPVILGALWFGLRGGVAVAFAVTLINLPYLFRGWSGWDPDDVNNVFEIVTYVVLGILLGLMRDRERRRAAELRQAETLSAVGRAMTALAHDVRNPAIAIGGLGRQVRDALPADDASRGRLDVIVDEAARVERMTGEMLDFSRPLELHCAPVDLAAVIERGRRVVELLARRRGVEVRIRVAPRLEPVPADESRLEQALINLLTNAVEASPSGGSVEVAASGDGRWARIEVSDDGPGIPLRLRSEIFSPFFTTKPRGTGLGLTIVRKIVDAHGGRILVVDGTSRGACFRVLLPAR